jgi:molecular chaperone DnaJ
MTKNYYTILGILPTASPEDIRGAYRKRAKELHPDHYGQNSNPFLEVQEAYGILSDPEDRRKYDLRMNFPHPPRPEPASSNIESLRSSRHRLEPLRANEDPYDFGILDLRNSFRHHRPSIEEIFDRFRRNFSPQEFYKGERLQDLCLEIKLTPDEAQRGGRFQIYVPTLRSCPTCRGRGFMPPCRCFRCMGGGSISEDVPVTVEYAPGISDGFQQAVSLQGLGIRDIYITLIFRISVHAD